MPGVQGCYWVLVCDICADGWSPVQDPPRFASLVPGLGSPKAWPQYTQVLLSSNEFSYLN